MKLRVDVRVLKAAAVILAVSLLLMGALALIHAQENRPQVDVPADSSPNKTPYDDEPVQELTYYNGSWYAKRQNLETVLILGLDKYKDTTQNGYNNNQQSDFILLLVLDRMAQRVTALRLNRDTMTQIRILGVNGEPAGTFTGQLTLAHTYGSGGTDSCENSALAVSNLLYGVVIDHYISMTMEGVAILNDLVGGVTVEVLDDFTGIDPTLVQGETITLNGQQALTYVRSRAGLDDSSNLRRMERQSQYLSALQKKIAARTDEDAGFLLSAVLAVSDYLVSDCTAEKLSELAETVDSYGISDNRTLEGNAVQGEEFVEFYVDEQALQDLVMDVFYELD